MKLLNTPSLAYADNETAVREILTRKAEQYEFNAAQLQDYIGRAFNVAQKRVNDLIIEKYAIENEIAKEKEQMEKAKEYLAVALTELGIETLKDKASEICSSIKVKESQEAYIEPKERSMTIAEMRELLEANGLPTKVWEDKEIEEKPATVSIGYRRGKKVGQITKKDAIEVLAKFNSIEYIENENSV